MQKRRLVSYLLVVLVNIGLASYAYVGNLTRMLADDLCSAYFASRLGLLRSIWYWYLNWSGRYSSFAADWFVLEYTLGPRTMHYVVPGLIFFWLLFSTLIAYRCFPKSRADNLVAALSVGGLFLYLVLKLSPDIQQSLFWWNGMRSYTLPLFVLTTYMLVFQLAVDKFKVQRILGSLLGFLLCFISSGFSETFAVAQLAFLLLVVGLYLFKLTKRPGTDLVILLSSLSGSLLSLIVIVAAPGNKIRLGPSPVTPGLLELVIISLQSYWSFLLELFAVPERTLGIIGAVLAVIWIGSQYKELAPANIHTILVCFIGGMAVSFACFPPGVYGYFASPPQRMMIIPVFFLVLGWLSAGLLLGSFLAANYRSLGKESGFLMLVILMLVGFSAIRTAWELYSTRSVYLDFAMKWDSVDELILQARVNGLETVKIPDMTNWAGLEIPTDNPKYWPTECYSKYYDIQVIGPPAPYP